MADSRHQEKTFTIENKTLESRKIVQSQKKKKKKMKSRKKFLKLWKIFPIREKKFRIEKNISN